MPINAEHKATHDSCQATGRLAAIRISGHDRISFLQGQLTQDVRRLTPATPLLAGWASPKGRLLCVPWLADWQESVWLILPDELADATAKRLKMFVLRADVRVERTDARVQPAPLEGLGVVIENDNQLDDSSLSYCLYNDNEFVIIPNGVTGMGIRIQPGLAAAATETATLERWRLLNIRAGLPLLGAAVAEEFVPQMVNLDLLGGISFTKGCYVGQEIVARTQNLGRIKRRMYAFNTPAAAGIASGQPVYGEQGTAGQVVDAISAGIKTELLAVIKIDCLEQTLSLQPGGEQPLDRQSLPYAIP